MKNYDTPIGAGSPRGWSLLLDMVNKGEKTRTREASLFRGAKRCKKCKRLYRAATSLSACCYGCHWRIKRAP